MKRWILPVAAGLVLWASGTSGAAEAPGGAEAPGAAEQRAATCWTRETLTDNWSGAGERLAEKGLSLGLSATQACQFNTRGGLATHRRAGRYAGSYDLEAEADLEKLAGWKGLSLYIQAEGSWSEGIDASSVGGLFGANADAAGDRSIDVTQFRFEQVLADGRLRIRIGKLDLTGGFECRGCPVSFDGSAFANDETSQFLNGALVNNPTIPFPDKGLGAAVHWEPVEGWYLSAGVADAQADARETGFNTAFDGKGHAFSVYETGYVAHVPGRNGPLPGAYRIGMWYEAQPKDRLDGRGTLRDDLGLYLSGDQMVLKEREDPEDGQGLGVFLRYGLADERVNPVRQFWSVGVQYQGLVAGRDDDVFGFGFAQGRTSRRGGVFSAAHESVFEAYYNIQVAPWLHVTPSVQHVVHPGGDSTVRDATVVGVRVQMAF